MIDNGARELRLFELDNGPLIHVEVNMEELPIFLFKSRDRVEESLEARNTIITEDGRRLAQYVKVTGGREFGLPGPMDRDAYVAVMRYVHRNGGMPADGWVSFTIYGLLRMMGKNPRAGKNHDNIRDSLDRIADCVIYAENAFYNNEDRDFESHRFNPWSVHFKSKRRKKGPSSERHTLKFHDILVRSYNANYLKSLDSDFYFSLRNALAKTLYGLIDVRRKGKLRWSVELMQLRQLIPLPDIYYQPSKIKERLDAAHRELLQRGFLTRVDHEERRGVHLVHYGISARFVRERTIASFDLSPRDRSVVEGLIEAGVWPETARKLVRDHGPSRLFDRLHLLVEYLLSFSLDCFERFFISFVSQAGFVYVVNGIGASERNGDDVQLGIGAIGEIYGCPGGQRCLPRTVGGQQDLGREDAHCPRLLAQQSLTTR